jgi:hypothetical protein
VKESFISPVMHVGFPFQEIRDETSKRFGTIHIAPHEGDVRRQSSLHRRDYVQDRERRPSSLGHKDSQDNIYIQSEWVRRSDPSSLLSGGGDVVEFIIIFEIQGNSNDARIVWYEGPNASTNGTNSHIINDMISHSSPVWRKAVAMTTSIGSCGVSPM